MTFSDLLAECHTMENQRGQQTSLYNGVSNRLRGWKTRRPPTMSRSKAKNPTVVRWDGSSKSSEAWDSLRRDPELWFQNGDCCIHLHGEGLSRRGPAFRVPYSALREASCQPLIDEFKPRANLKPNELDQVNSTSATSYHENITNQIELFIPAPSESDKRQSYTYHLATRNLFAFIFHRPVVGECLGSTLITLVHNLHQFRTSDADNIQDLMSYMNEMGYSDVSGHPTHALAMLHLAEAFRLRDLYIDAFAHCCGMFDQLVLLSEYQLLSSVTSDLIRRARFEMRFRLERASLMLKTFLYDEVCETNMELYPGAKEHLGLFRTLLQGVYAVRFGYYPPPSIDAQITIFGVDVLRAMRSDFGALYEFLVDESFQLSKTSQSLTEDGICALRGIKSFDRRYEYETLRHPIPLLPDIPQRKTISWRLWRNRGANAPRWRRGDPSMVLSRATNPDRPDIVNSHLVRAYRKFEEDQALTPTKADNVEVLGLIEGRMTRWILIYAIYQTLRQVTEVAKEISDPRGFQYHLCISTAGLPPWEEEKPEDVVMDCQLDLDSESPTTCSSPCLGDKRDDDDPAFANEGTESLATRHVNTISKGNFADSVSRRSATIWRSLSVLTKHERERRRSAAQKAPYHEIVIPRYGNGMNTLAANEELAVRRPSAYLDGSLGGIPIGSSVSGPSNSSSQYSHSEIRTSGTDDTSLTDSPGRPEIERKESERASLCTRCGLQEINCDISPAGWPRPLSANARRYNPHSPFAQPNARSRRRPVSAQEDHRRQLEPAPLNISSGKKMETPAADIDIRMPSPQTPTPWSYVQAVMEVQASNCESVGAEWDQFAHLGRFIEVGSENPATDSTQRRLSAIF
ncbi:hypothetical protein F4802DRAFT_181229 [Xylaria palmicola]|nr:hypothetical protein F4802DRAFT_181229 [Xylaria palmicola]